MNRVGGQDQPAITLVSAPAGFGKTTLLTELFAGDQTGDPRLAWLSLDTSDDDPARFWSYAIAALRTVAPAVGDTSLALLRSDPAGLEPVIATLVNELAVLPLGVVLVFDDYHVIDGDAPAVAAEPAVLVAA
jgi:LuxR family maltose regulon positive regulatory protein